jgi:hypothetical protein
VNRSVTVRLGTLAAKALTGYDKDGTGARNGGGGAAEGVSKAVRFYLHDRESDGPGWEYPRFLRDPKPGEELLELELDIDESLWRALKSEADRQGVDVPRLLEHAALYYAAGLDAGRVTERILGDLEEE